MNWWHILWQIVAAALIFECGWLLGRWTGADDVRREWDEHEEARRQRGGTR